MPITNDITKKSRYQLKQASFWIRYGTFQKLADDNPQLLAARELARRDGMLVEQVPVKKPLFVGHHKLKWTPNIVDKSDLNHLGEV